MSRWVCLSAILARFLRRLPLPLAFVPRTVRCAVLSLRFSFCSVPKHPYASKLSLSSVDGLNLRHLLLKTRTGMSTTSSAKRNCSALSGPWATVVHNSVNNLVQRLHCGISLLWHNWNVQYSVEGTETREEHVRLRLLEHGLHD